ncbi:MAG: carboxymuconolactone decarboxylase family protein [Gemmatimonadota bacterium]
MKQQDALDPQTLSLVRFAAAVAQGDEPDIRERADDLRTDQVPATWVEELLLQSVLMVGYPRTLVALGIWRKISRLPAPATDPDTDYSRAALWAERGEETCQLVYGDNYKKLRENVKSLHPAMDAWMITEGYGRTLARPGLDLLRRELCTVVQTAVLDTARQLHSHLRGALNAGASVEQVDATMAAVNPVLAFDHWKRVKEIWRGVRDDWNPLD